MIEKVFLYNKSTNETKRIFLIRLSEDNREYKLKLKVTNKTEKMCKRKWRNWVKEHTKQ
jgi:hypothetical protein